MSRIQSMRLGQFWTHRLVPLLTRSQARGQFHETELFEAVGWLAEGVFCRYFDAVDADVVWIRLSDELSAVKVPTVTLPKERVEKIRVLIRARQPFRDALQMTEGAQRRFEQPLFPAACCLPIVSQPIDWPVRRLRPCGRALTIRPRHWGRSSV